MKRSSLVMSLGACAALLIGVAGTVRAQAAPEPKPATLEAGKKVNDLQGAVIHREGEEFTMRTIERLDYRVLMTDQTTIKATHRPGWRAPKGYDMTSIIDGLVLRVDGVGDAQGRIVAEKIRYTEADLHSAITTQIHTRPVDVQAKAAEESAKAAGESAEAAHGRISSLDNWVEKGVVSVFFKTGSAEIQPDGIKALDDLAAKAPGKTNYRVEITGHTDTVGSNAVNDDLSERRAEAVVQYLTVTKGIPLRRVVLPQGYAATLGKADNSTEAGRAQNRRVDVRVFVNPALGDTSGNPPAK